MTTPSVPPPGKQQTPGIPSKQIWDAASFHTPPHRLFPWQWVGSLPGFVRMIVVIVLVVFALRIMNLL